MAIGSIPGLSFIQNELAVFILSIILIYTDRIENFDLFFPTVTKFRILFSASELKATR